MLVPSKVYVAEREQRGPEKDCTKTTLSMPLQTILSQWRSKLIQLIPTSYKCESNSVNSFQF